MRLPFLCVIGIALFLYGLVVPPIYATDCTVTPGGNVTISSSCSFPYTVDGVDTGTGSTNTALLQVNSGTLTILGTQTVALGSLTLGGGSVAIVDGGSMKIGTPLWMTDADSDCSAATTTQVAQSSAPGNGRRRNLICSLTLADCRDSDAANTTCAPLSFDQTLGLYNRIKSVTSPNLETYYQELPVDINTVGLWHMNEGTGTAADSSGNSNTGTLANGAAWNTAANSKLGASSVSLDGINDYITIPDSPSLGMTKSFTIEAWVKRTGGTGSQEMIITKDYNPAGNNRSFKLSFETTNKLDFLVSPANDCTGCVQLASNTAITDTTNWIHYAAVFEASKYMAIYINGVLDAYTTTVPSGIYDGTNAIEIGARSGEGTGTVLTGYVDEVRISNIARTPEEIRIDALRRPYGIWTSATTDLTLTPMSWTNLTVGIAGNQTGNGETPLSTSGLLAQWNFNETSGTTAVSGGSCGTSCNGTLTGFASTSSQDQASGTGWTANNRRWGAGALNFDGTNDTVLVGSESSFDFERTSAFSINAWIKTTTTSAAEIFSKLDNNSAGPGYELNITNGKLCVILNNNWSTNTIYVCASKTVNDGQTHLVTFTYDGSSTLTGTKFYIDAKFITQDAATYNSLSSTMLNNVSPYIGSKNNQAYYFPGVIDAVSAYSRELSITEILSNYQAGNIEFQTRTSADNSTWEAWKPTTNETQLLSLDADSTNAGWNMHRDAHPSGDILKYDTTNSTEANSYSYWKTLSGNSVVVNTNDTLEYDVYLNTNVATIGTIDMTFTDASVLRSYVGCHGGDLTGVAYQKWYHRSCTIPAGANGKTISYVNLVNEYDVNTPTTVYYDNVVVKNSSGTVKSVLYGNGTTGFNTLEYESNGVNTQTLTVVNNFGATNITTSDDSTAKMEGSGSMKMAIGAPQVEGNTVALWHLDETSDNANDSTTLANTLTANASPGVSDGFYGKARTFNGSTQYFSCTDANCGTTSKLDFGNTGFSVSAWIKINTTGATRTVMGKLDGGTNSGYRLDISSAEKIVFHIQNSSAGSATGATTISTNTWHHVAGVYNGSSILVYLDGVQDGTALYSAGSADNSQSFYVGSATGPSNYFSGTIDEPFVTAKAFSADEIAEAYRAGRDHRLSRTVSSNDLSTKSKLPFYVASDRPGTFMEATVGESAFANYEPDANTVGLWHLEEKSTGAAAVTRKDSSGNGNDLTDTNTVPSTQGKIGQAAQFNHSNLEYLTINDNASLSMPPIFTISAWVNPTSFLGLNEPVFCKGPLTAGSYEYCLYYELGTNRLRFFTSNNGTNVYTTDATTAFVAGNWYHVAVKLNSDYQYIYINGVLEGTTATSTAMYDGTGAFQIGARSTGGTDRNWNGLIDEVYVTKRAVSDDEIRQQYEIGRRTHPITIDFVTSPQAAYSSGTSVTINNPYGTTALTNTLSIGDTMIFKENVNGTETIGQAVVSAIANTSTSYGTVTLASAPSFPSGGYTTNATVFKWQREYFDLTGSLSTHRDAITRLTYRVTDGFQGANVWLDDIKSANYINKVAPDTVNTGTGVGTYIIAGSNITSTKNRYIQLRAVLSSTDPAVSAQLVSGSIEYQ